MVLVVFLVVGGRLSRSRLRDTRAEIASKGNPTLRRCFLFVGNRGGGAGGGSSPKLCGGGGGENISLSSRTVTVSYWATRAWMGINTSSYVCHG